MSRDEAYCYEEQADTNVSDPFAGLAWALKHYGNLAQTNCTVMIAIPVLFPSSWC